MATEGKSEETQMEQNIAQIHEQEKDEKKTEDIKDGEKKEDEKKTEDIKDEEKKEDEEKTKEIVSTEVETENISSANIVEKGSSSSGEESSFTSELKEYEKKALFALRKKIEEEILENKFFKKMKENDVKEKSMEKESVKEENVEAKEKSAEEAGEKKEDEGKEEETHQEVDADKKEVSPKDIKVEGDGIAEEGEKETTNCAVMEEKEDDHVDKDISLWGVPLLPSKGDERTDVILLKFLRAREWNASNAFEMLRNTVQWRKENNIDSILDEEFEADICSAAYLEGKIARGIPCVTTFLGRLAMVRH